MPTSRKEQFLEEQINWFKKQLFDRSSEKLSGDDINILQGSLFNEIENIADHHTAAEESVIIPERKRKKKGRKHIDDKLPRIILTDGYAAYDSVAKEKGLIHAGCMAHLRRYFNDAKKVAQPTH